jgi:hypothetical protein
MIDVTVCDQDRIELADPGSQRLLPKVARRIDQEPRFTVLDQCRLSQALVSWIS